MKKNQAKIEPFGKADYLLLKYFTDLRRDREQRTDEGIVSNWAHVSDDEITNYLNRKPGQGGFERFEKHTASCYDCVHRLSAAYDLSKETISESDTSSRSPVGSIASNDPLSTTPVYLETEGHITSFAFMMTRGAVFTVNDTGQTGRGTPEERENVSSILKYFRARARGPRSGRAINSIAADGVWRGGVHGELSIRGDDLRDEDGLPDTAAFARFTGGAFNTTFVVLPHYDRYNLLLLLEDKTGEPVPRANLFWRIQGSEKWIEENITGGVERITLGASGTIELKLNVPSNEAIQVSIRLAVPDNSIEG